MKQTDLVILYMASARDVREHHVIRAGVARRALYEECLGSTCNKTFELHASVSWFDRACQLSFIYGLMDLPGC